MSPAPLSRQLGLQRHIYKRVHAWQTAACTPLAGNYKASSEQVKAPTEVFVLGMLQDGWCSAVV